MSSPLPTAPAAADAAVHTTEPRTAAGLQGVRRRVVYVTLYELIAIAVATVGLAALTGQSAAHASVASVAASVIAVVWNIVFNWAFERWESRQAVRGRSVARRVAHAIGFEGGLVFTLVPLFAWWFNVSLWEALVMDFALIVFFLVYTFVFNWVFDRIFGLPASAQG
ncbi:PACE efflux transporter [Acidovorax lacteus]|uniref:PACE efflux transporter n=1 Tax=Acidovorax lacteus TaxID=1924988 RepID=A0ABP8LAD3_9BURK